VIDIRACAENLGNVESDMRRRAIRIVGVRLREMMCGTGRLIGNAPKSRRARYLRIRGRVRAVNDSCLSVLRSAVPRMASLAPWLRTGSCIADKNRIQPACRFRRLPRFSAQARISITSIPLVPARRTQVPSRSFNGDLLQIMPWPGFQNFTDHDILALYTYLTAILS